MKHARIVLALLIVIAAAGIGLHALPRHIVIDATYAVIGALVLLWAVAVLVDASMDRSKRRNR